MRCRQGLLLLGRQAADLLLLLGRQAAHELRHGCLHANIKLGVPHAAAASGVCGHALHAVAVIQLFGGTDPCHYAASSSWTTHHCVSDVISISSLRRNGPRPSCTTIPGKLVLLPQDKQAPQIHVPHAA